MNRLSPAADANSRGGRSAFNAVELFLLAAFACFFFFLGLNAIGLTGADEPRYAQIAREMLTRHDWVVPVLRGRPWLEKPILYYWEAMLSYRWFGVSDWSARLPSAVNACALVLAVYGFARRFARGAQVDAALMTASSAFAITFGRAASMDMLLTACFTAGMFCWIASRLNVLAAKWWHLAFCFFMALGTLAKGPVAPLLAAMVILAFTVIQKSWRPVLDTLWWPGILFFLAVALPWYLLVQWRAGDFFRIFLLQHNVQRFSTSVYHHTQPVWFFLAVILIALAPWTVVCFAGLIEGIQNVLVHRPYEPDGDELDLFLVLWAGLPVLFFTLSRSKLPGYILPSIPPFAMLAALWMRRKREEFESLPAGLLLLHSLLAGGMLTAALLSWHILWRVRPSREAVVIATVAGGMAAVSIWVVVRFCGLQKLRLITLFPILIALVFLLRFEAPAVDPRLSARTVAKEIESVAPARAPVAVYRVDRDIAYGLDFYLDQPTLRYETGEMPPGNHFLVAEVAFAAPADLAAYAPNRRFTLLGSSANKKLDFYWVTAK